MLLLHHIVRNLSGKPLGFVFGIDGSRPQFIGHAALLFDAGIVWPYFARQDIRLQLPTVGHFSECAGLRSIFRPLSCRFLLSRSRATIGHLRASCATSRREKYDSHD
jgi:hypothetical protein